MYLSDSRERCTKPSSWCRDLLNWTPKGKGPMNSVLVESLEESFFFENAVYVFFYFLHTFMKYYNMGQKMT